MFTEAVGKAQNKSGRSLPSLLSGGRARLFFFLVAIGAFQALMAVAVALATRDTFNVLLGNRSVDSAASATSTMSVTLAILGAAAIAGIWLRWRGDLE
ncbi:MAG: hypothetical protein AAFY56_06345, partial [Pseudomonadota bacterium]